MYIYKTVDIYIYRITVITIYKIKSFYMFIVMLFCNCFSICLQYSRASLVCARYYADSDITRSVMDPDFLPPGEMPRVRIR